MLNWFTISVQIVRYVYETLRDMAELNIVSPVISELDYSDGLGSTF